MVFTIEPGIYIGPYTLIIAKNWYGEGFAKNIEKKVLKYNNIGIRIEDDILVVENGCKVLSKNIPKKIYEIEKILNK